jgi:hypothetical protein
MKLKSFYTTKEMVSTLRMLHIEWEKVFASHTADKRLITRIYRELKNQTPKKPLTQLINGQLN